MFTHLARTIRLHFNATACGFLVRDEPIAKLALNAAVRHSSALRLPGAARLRQPQTMATDGKGGSVDLSRIVFSPVQSAIIETGPVCYGLLWLSASPADTMHSFAHCAITGPMVAMGKLWYWSSEGIDAARPADPPALAGDGAPGFVIEGAAGDRPAQVDWRVCMTADPVPAGVWREALTHTEARLQRVLLDIHMAKPGNTLEPWITGPRLVK